MADIVRTRIGEAKHMDKWEPSVLMIRLARDLQAELEEAGWLDNKELNQIDKIIRAFQATLPQKVQGELREG